MYDVWVVDFVSGDRCLLRSKVSWKFVRKLVDRWERTDSGFLVVRSDL